jgi:hypothetical protein
LSDPSQKPDFLPGVAVAHVVDRLRKAGGNEIESGKLASPESSAALAVNTLGWFIERPSLLPPLPGLTDIGAATRVDVEYCARFPWSGGRHPWLDAIVETRTHLVGVESKRFEPYRDRKAVSLSPAYDRHVWGDRMQPFEQVRDALRSGLLRFEYLDASQLVKHAFGLVTDAKRRGLRPALFYLYAEPKLLGTRRIDQLTFDAHREEIARFAEVINGAEVKFAASSYRDWLRRWQGSDPVVAHHALAILERFGP